MATYASVEQVAVELGRLPGSVTDAEVLQWQQWLGRVERDIASRFTRSGLSLSEQVAASNPDEATVADVEIAAVVRKIENPFGDTSTSVTVDDASVTRRKEGAGTVIGLDLTEAEWERLLPEKISGAFSTRPGFQADRSCWWDRP